MREITRLIGDALHHARLARRHLAENREPDRIAFMRDRGHLHRHIVTLERDVTVALAERPFWFEKLGVDQALDDELGVRRHVEIDGEALTVRIGAPASAPATAISSQSIGSFCGPANITTGAQPTTIAIGIGCLSLRYFCQCR